MDYSKLHWHSDFMLSEILGIDYDDMVDDRAAGCYSLMSFPEINMYIDVENNKILEVWLEEDE